MKELDLQRRFSGVRRLYGDDALVRFNQAHVCVIGIGGVGSWAAEALARNAVGRITLIDLDNVAESNVNRQLHAVDSAFGKAKVTAMAERIRSINPQCEVFEIEDFVTPENAATLLANGCDVVLDAIDDAKAKVAIAAYCRQHKKPLVMTGGAGGRLDPVRMQTADLAKTTGDRLLAKVRNQLRRDHGFPKGDKTRFGIPCVYSDEQVHKPHSENCDADAALTGLNCAGYGSSVCVTASFGMTAAALVLDHLRKA